MQQTWINCLVKNLILFLENGAASYRAIRSVCKEIFFHLLGRYIFCKPKAMVFFDKLDVFCYKWLPFMRGLSYHRLLVLKKLE